MPDCATYMPGLPCNLCVGEHTYFSWHYGIENGGSSFPGVYRGGWTDVEVRGRATLLGCICAGAFIQCQDHWIIRGLTWAVKRRQS